MPDANQRHRGRSRSRDTPRNVRFPTRGSTSTARDDGGDRIRAEPATPGRCTCEECSNGLRDLSIRYPGMSRESFHQMMLMLDEVGELTGSSSSVSDSSSSLSMSIDSSQYSPAEPSPRVVPASPSEIQAPDERPHSFSDDSDDRAANATPVVVGVIHDGGGASS